MARTRTTRTAGKDAEAAPIAALPSAHDLMCHAAIALNLTDRDGNMTSIGIDRFDALTDVALAYPARTIKDAVAQLVTAYHAASDLNDSEGDRDFLRGRVKRLRRALLSALPPIAEAAGADLVQLGGENLMDIRAAEFGLEDGQR